MHGPFGALLGFGANKGSGLSSICNLLGAALTGGETQSSPHQGGSGIINNMRSIISAPSLPGADEHYTQAINDMLAWTHASPSDDELQLPGDKNINTADSA